MVSNAPINSGSGNDRLEVFPRCRNMRFWTLLNLNWTCVQRRISIAAHLIQLRRQPFRVDIDQSQARSPHMVTKYHEYGSKVEHCSTFFPVHTDDSFWTRSSTVWTRSATFCYVYACDFPSGHRALTRWQTKTLPSLFVVLRAK